jgi:hypothetical protein
MLNSLEGIRVGDENLWDCGYGRGYCESEVDFGNGRTLVIKFESHKQAMWYQPSGRSYYNPTEYPTLFFAPWCGTHGVHPYPTRPRRTKMVEAWRFIRTTRHGRATDFTERFYPSYAAMGGWSGGFDPELIVARVIPIDPATGQDLPPHMIEVDDD